MKIALICLTALWMVSCTTYHCDTERRGVLSQIYVNKVENDTTEGEIGSLLKRQLQEHFTTIPGTERIGENAWMNLDAKVTTLQSSSKANAELRNEDARSEESGAYQTVLQTITIIVEYSVTDWTDGGKELLKGTVKAMADAPRMHDRNVSLKQAYLQATNDAALQICNAIVDANLEK